MGLSGGSGGLDKQLKMGEAGREGVKQFSKTTCVSQKNIYLDNAWVTVSRTRTPTVQYINATVGYTRQNGGVL